MAQTVEARVTHRFKASAARVFDAWLDPQFVRRWMAMPAAGMGPFDVRRVEIDARVGGRFTFSDMRAEGEAVHWGYYHAIERPTRLVFSWFTSEEEEREDESLVTIVITPLDRGCEVTLVHSMSAKWAEYVGRTEQGWGAMLGKLDAFLDAE